MCKVCTVCKVCGTPRIGIPVAFWAFFFYIHHRILIRKERAISHVVPMKKLDNFFGLPTEPLFVHEIMQNKLLFFEE